MGRSDGGGAPVILMYHRVGTGGEDPWGLAVSPVHFAEQMAVLARRREVVRLTDLAERLATGRSVADLAALTFDDGYADNLTAAYPVLRRLSLPATVFVVADAIGAPDELWWDELGRIFLAPGLLPVSVTATIGGVERSWPLGGACRYEPADAAVYRRWCAAADPPTARHRLYVELWRLLRRQEPGERRLALAALRRSAGIEEGARPDRRMLTGTELILLGSGGLVDIGAHSLSHAALPEQAPDRRAVEIAGGKRVLEKLLGQRVNAFAYPFGDYDDACIAAVAAAGFTCAVTTDPRPVPSGPDLFRLPRLAVGDWAGETFDAWLAAGCA